jgi:nitroreductase
MQQATEVQDIFEIIYGCRAMRRLKPDAVPDELLERALDAAHQAPSGSNAQSRHWVVVRDPERKARLAELNRRSAEPYLKAQRGALDAMPHQDAAARARMMDAVEWQMEHMHEIPVLVVACAQLSGPPRESYQAGAGAASDIWAAVQNFLLAARALGLGAAPTTLSLVDRAAVQAALDLPENVVAHCLIPVGFPRGRFGPVSRRPLGEVVHRDRW